MVVFSVYKHKRQEQQKNTISVSTNRNKIKLHKETEKNTFTTYMTSKRLIYPFLIY